MYWMVVEGMDENKKAEFDERLERASTQQVSSDQYREERRRIAKQFSE